MRLFSTALIIILIVVIVFGLLYLLYPKALKNGNVKVKIGFKEWRVDVANNDWSRARGLSGRKVLGDSEGMLFIFDKPKVQKFWMKGMNFPLDIIWINGSKVVGVSENLPLAPLMDLKLYSSNEPVNLVLEINAGSAKKWNIVSGSEVFIYEGDKLVLY